MVIQQEEALERESDEVSFKKYEQQYVEMIDWEVRENANTNRSYGNFLGYILDKTMKKPEVLASYLPSDAVEYHFKGWLHVHKLPHSLYIPYCAGWSIEKILRMGLKTPTIISRPARHLDTAVSHLINFFFLTAQEWTGAVAVSAFDLFMAPFVRKDNLNYKQVKQCLQKMLFELNYPSRMGYQSPFTNITLVIDTSDSMLNGSAITDGKVSGKLGDYVDEAILIDNALLDLYSEGDALGQPFSVSGDTYTIIVENGEYKVVKIGEYVDSLFRRYKDRAVKRHEYEVLSLNGLDIRTFGFDEHKQVLMHKVKYVVRHRTHKILKITCEGGFEVKVTPTHSVFTYRGGKIVAVRASDLGEGDYILGIGRLPSENIRLEINVPKLLALHGLMENVFLSLSDGRGIRLKEVQDKIDEMNLEECYVYLGGSKHKVPCIVDVDEELAYFLGFFLSGGRIEGKVFDVSRRAGSVELVLRLNIKPGEDVVGRIIGIIRRKFNIEPKVKVDKLRNLIEVRICSRLLARIFTLLLGSRGRAIPSAIYRAPYTVKVALLAGYLDGDRTAEIRIDRVKWDSFSIAFHSTEAGLAYSIAYLLLQMGIPIKLYRYYPGGYMSSREYYYVIAPASRLPSEILEYSYKLSELKKHALKTELTENAWRRAVEVIAMCDGGISEAKPSGRDGDLVFMRIRKIEEIEGDFTVYDLSTEEGAFIANNFIVHNTFPIPTIMLTKKFDWNGRRWGELTDKIFTALARKGTAYLLNGNATNVEALYSMCCRLTINISRLNNNNFSLKLIPTVKPGGDGNYTSVLKENRQAFGIWALPDATGSIGVVTINMPRIAILSKGEWDKFEELLEKLLLKARKVLQTWRSRYNLNLSRGFMPLTKTYLGHFMNHFNTFGIIGLPEAAANFMRDPELWIECNKKRIDEAVAIMRRMVSYVRRRAKEFEQMDGVLYNVEEIPGESTGYRLASIDAARFKEEIRRGEVFMPMYDGVPFYSNSVIPYYADVPIYRRAVWEGTVQGEFTGGVMMHLFLNESPDPRALKNLIYRIVHDTRVVYFSITPTLAVCRKCGWKAVGVYDKCPSCGNENVDHWSRIVGYYRPVRNWNIGKKAEFKLRVHYGINSIVSAS